MTEWLRHMVARMRRRLWVRPLVSCVVAIVVALVAQLADRLPWNSGALTIDAETIQVLLSIISTTMLAVATFAVGSMVAAYNSVSTSATPRAFTLVLADDMSQTALSSFIGAFIFSIVATVALRTGFYGPLGRLALFGVTILIIAWVILTFVRWVDYIARLGRMGNTIDKVTEATMLCLVARRDDPYLGGLKPLDGDRPGGDQVAADCVGYVQRLDMVALQSLAEAAEATLHLTVVPGSFVAPGTIVAHITGLSGPLQTAEREGLLSAIKFGDDRTFEYDPRFGLIVLSEVAGRALSPAVNDPGTAIVIMGRLIRLFAAWARPAAKDGPKPGRYDRVHVPGLQLADMFDDAFTAISRDGAGTVELGVRLQKTFAALADLPAAEYATEVRRHADLALERAKVALQLPSDLDRLIALNAKLHRQLGDQTTSG